MRVQYLFCPHLYVFRNESVMRGGCTIIFPCYIILRGSDDLAEHIKGKNLVRIYRVMNAIVRDDTFRLHSVRGC